MPLADAVRDYKTGQIEEQIAEDDQEKVDLIKVFELAKGFTNPPHILLPKMQTAVKAVDELQKLFVEQGQNLEAIQKSLTSLQGGVSAAS